MHACARVHMIKAEQSRVGTREVSDEYVATASITPTMACRS